MDKNTKIKSSLVFIVFFGLLILFTFISRKTGDRLAILVLSLLLIVYFVILIGGFLLTPYSYKLSNESLLIKRRRLSIGIPLKDIHAIREFGLEDRKGLIKTFGAEGVIGNIGRWSSKTHKSLRLITSRDTNWVLIRLKSGKKYVISPDDMELVQKTKEKITEYNGA